MNIVLNSEDVVLRSEEIVSEIQQRARESHKKGSSIGGIGRRGSIDPNLKPDVPKTNTAEELVLGIESTLTLGSIDPEVHGPNFHDPIPKLCTVVPRIRPEIAPRNQLSGF